MNITKQNKLFEIICFCFFIICTIFISFYHEPWRDEFQAWAISKDTFYNILFVIPHFEGHPPLWYLIYKCFSSFNINPEVGMRIPNLLFMFASVFLLIFKSPFPKIIRLLLPFTYFIFYQYSVISRPYSIFCFALFLSALFYKEKNKHPFKFICALSLLSLSSAFGIVFTAGILLVWFIEIIKEEKLTFIKNIINDNRFKAMCILSFLCLILTCTIFINKNAFNDIFVVNSMKKAYMSVAFFTDSILTNITYSPDYFKLNAIHYITAIALYIGLFILLKIYKSLLLFFIPYSMFWLTSFSLYVYGHHTGLTFLFLIFVFWCSISTKKINLKYPKLIFSLVLIPICVQIYWSICAYISEYKYDYNYSRSLSNYIKENNLSEHKIMCEWYLKYGVKNQKSYLVDYNYNIQYVPVSIIPYFNKNIFYNFNMLYPDKQYIVLKKMSDKDKFTVAEQMRQYGLPDYIIGNPQFLYLIFSEEYVNNTNYKLIKTFKYNQIWKDKAEESILPIFKKENV